MNAFIPFNRPSATGNARLYVEEALSSSKHAGDGPFTRRCHKLLEELLGVPKVLLTTSCTHALEMAALLLDLRPGDEVIVPSFAFVSTANAFALRGVHIVFCDIRADTINLDECLLASLVTPRTRAIVLIHYAGVGCEMEAICEIARRHQLVIIEDNAHGLFGRYKGRWLGTFGTLATQSFHETKNFSCGEGGALIINDPMFIPRAEIVREKGTDRSRFFRGEVDKYSWVDLGSSYLPSDILAALLLSQLEERAIIQNRRSAIWHTYYSSLGQWASGQEVALPVVPAYCEQAFHMFYLLLPSLSVRGALITHLKEHGILSVFHYLPLHLSQYAQRWGAKPRELPVAEKISDRLLRLPFYNALDRPEQDRVIEAILQFRP